MRLSVQKKLMGSFALVLLITMVVGWQGIVGMADINEALNAAYTDRFVPARVIANTKVALAAWNRAILSHVLAKSLQEMDEYERVMTEQQAAMLEQFEILSKTKHLSEREKELVWNLSHSLQDTEPIQNRVVLLSRAGKQEEGHQLIGAELRPVLDKMGAEMTEFIRLQEGQLRETVNATDEHYLQHLRQISWTIATAIFLSFLIIYLLSHTIIKAVNEMTRGAKLVAAGDLQQARLTIASKDEFGYLGVVFNQMLDSLMQLRQAQKMEVIAHLAGGVAHDFNNLLTGITGYTHLLLEQAKADSASSHDLNQIQELADRAAHLTRQLLAFSRQQTLEPTVLTINSLVESTTKLLGRLIGEDIDLQFVAAPDLGNVRADPSRIEQVLMNLAINARDAMPDGGTLTIETANVVLDREQANQHLEINPGPYVMLTVTDTGCGMDQATQGRIFDPFFTTKEVGKGTGLGLSTVYGIVKQHGGHIRVHSEPGQETTFKIYLPRVEAEAQELAVPAKEEVLGGAEAILVVEDEGTVRALVQRVLEGQGYRVLCATYPKEAEEVFAQHDGKTALLLTDVVMPGGNGPDLYKRLAVKHPSLKVLYMSGYADSAILHSSGLDAGRTFLPKPFTPEALARKVREVLEAGVDTPTFYPSS